MIEYDVETTGLQPFAERHYPFLFQFYDGNEAVAYTYAPDAQENRPEIQRWLNRGADEGLRAWNSKFDLHFGENAGFELPPSTMWHDEMVVTHAIDERRSVALKAVAKTMFGEDAADLQVQVKAWLTRERARRKKEAETEGTELIEPNYSDVPMELMEPYGLEDVFLTRRVAEVNETILANQPELRKVVEFERETMGSLFAIEKRGLPADPDAYRSLEIEVIENLEILEDRVKQLAGSNEFNPKSSAQIVDALRERGADISFLWNEETGRFSADKQHLEAVDDELAAEILNFRSEFKVLSTYVRPMIGRSYDTSTRSYKEPFIASDGRIHATYRQVGARTGRMSCADPNIQNQPRDDLRLRYNIVADPGFKLVTCDLSNIEMVLFAAYAGNGRMLEAAINGEDMHLLTARMLGLRDRARPGGIFESARQLGKTYNFSRLFGGGIPTIQRQFRLKSRDDARKLKNRYDQAYPEIARLQNRIEFKLRDQGYIQDKLISGRKFRVAMRDSYKAVNYLIQGTAAALLKYAMNNLHQDGIPMVGLVHDEIVAHVPAEDAEEAKLLIIRRLTEHEGLKGIVPLRAEGEVVNRWSDAKPFKDGTLFVPKWAQVD